MSNLDIKKECFSCNSRSECKNYYSYDEENCDKYYPDDMELPIWVFETIDNRYVGKECCRTKFLYKAEIGTYMELYENGIAAFNDGSHDIYSSGIIKISDVSACNKREREYIDEYLNNLVRKLQERGITWESLTRKN